MGKWALVGHAVNPLPPTPPPPPQGVGNGIAVFPTYINQELIPAPGPSKSPFQGPHSSGFSNGELRRAILGPAYRQYSTHFPKWQK